MMNGSQGIVPTVDLATNNNAGFAYPYPVMGGFGGSEFIIIGGGTFEVQFNANVTSDTAGQVALALKTGTGTDVEGTEVDAVITTAGDYTNVSFTKIIKVCPRVNTAISVGSLAAVGGVTPAVATVIPTVKDANLLIRRLN